MIGIHTHIVLPDGIKFGVVARAEELNEFYDVPRSKF